MNKHLYAQTLQDEELTEGVTYLHQRDTGLPCDIIVDCGKTYEYYNHPLCLYIVNGNNYMHTTADNQHFTKFTYGQYGNELTKFLVENVFA